MDPLFVSAAATGTDLHLQAGSPAVDAGGPLTTVAAADSGSGTSLVVDDATYFQPGWAGTLAGAWQSGLRAGQQALALLGRAAV